MNQFWERTGTILGRFLLALIFVASGVGKLMTIEKTANQVKGDAAETVDDVMTA